MKVYHALVLFVLALLVGILLTGCMSNTTNNYCYAEGGSYINTWDTGGQSKPIQAGVDAKAGDKAIDAAAGALGGGVGAAVAGPAGAALGAGAMSTASGLVTDTVKK